MKVVVNYWRMDDGISEATFTAYDEIDAVTKVLDWYDDGVMLQDISNGERDPFTSMASLADWFKTVDAGDDTATIIGSITMDGQKFEVFTDEQLNDWFAGEEGDDDMGEGFTGGWAPKSDNEDRRKLNGLLSAKDYICKNPDDVKDMQSIAWDTYISETSGKKDVVSWFYSNFPSKEEFSRQTGIEFI